jgi:hypothetical protein
MLKSIATASGCAVSWPPFVLPPPPFFRLENASDYARRRGNARFRFLRRWMRDDALAQVNNTRHRRCWAAAGDSGNSNIFWPSTRLSIDSRLWLEREKEIFFDYYIGIDSIPHARFTRAPYWPVAAGPSIITFSPFHLCLPVQL